ncbi:hypothetical protein CFP56_032951 [Quercus suber]|uniref:Uncharacterized protein n=1 Tax=Quercus suber TaxID=58331 RepID=A0AAW0JGK5_QUESU
MVITLLIKKFLHSVDLPFLFEVIVIEFQLEDKCFPNKRGLEIEIDSMDWKIGDNSVVFWRSAATTWWFGAAAMIHGGVLEIGGDGVVFWSGGDGCGLGG